MHQKIKWGIVGLGSIAHHFVKDLLLVEDAELVAVASRNKEKALEFSVQYQSKYHFGTYEALFQCPEVTVIYIATPHSFHAEMAIEAMKHGKHVLCEKPLGVNRLEVERMVNAAKENKVFLMEALWSRFNPSIRKVQGLISENVIGDITYLHADFAFPALHRDPSNRLLNPELAGGSLLDIGIYPIFLSYWLLGKPKNIQATAHFFKTGIEMQVSMIFEYAGAQAMLYSGLQSNSKMEAEISGTKGSLFLDPKWHEAQGYSLELNGSTEHFELPTTGRGYFHEIVEVHKCLQNSEIESSLWSHQNSLDLISLLDNVRALTGIVFPFEQ